MTGQKKKSFSPKKIFKKLTPLLPYLVGTAKIVVAVLVIFVSFNLVFAGRIFPNVSIAGVDVSGLTPEEAKGIITKEKTFPKKITLVLEDETYDMDLTDIDLVYDLDDTTISAYNIFRTGNLVHDAAARIESLWKVRSHGIRVKYDEQKLDEVVSVIGGQVSQEPVYPSVAFTSGEIVVNNGRIGREIDLKRLKLEIGQALTFAKSDPITISAKIVNPTLTAEGASALKIRAQILVGKSLALTFEFQTFNFSETAIFPLLDPNSGYQDDKIEKLIDTLSSIERAPQNPNFVFEEGRVKEFAPAKPGAAIDRPTLATLIKQKLNALESTEEKTASAPIAVKLTQPELTTDKVNDLGIKELIGRGTSAFRGSIPSRVFNVNHAATKLNGVLIKPGETFSFNGVIGDISKLTGFKEAYVIKDGKTVLGDGGGVCQVSTTMFRAAMNAGLPIVERRPHAYRVGYYEQDSQPGLDATIYSPTTDFKFLNDTSGHILIQAYPDTKNYTLAFELYGTNDGRVSEVTKPIVSGVTPAPEDLYVDDPTLPAGTIKQVEHKAAGAKSTFSYKVTKGGSTVYEKTFVSNYRPWQAVYQRGTGPAAQ